MQLCSILQVLMGYMRKLHYKATNSSHSEHERTNTAQHTHHSSFQSQGFYFGLLWKIPRSNTTPTEPKLVVIFSRGWTRLSRGPRGRRTSAETGENGGSPDQRRRHRRCPTTTAAPEREPGKAHLRHGAGGRPGERGPAGCRAPGAVPVPSRRARP